MGRCKVVPENCAARGLSLDDWKACVAPLPRDFKHCAALAPYSCTPDGVTAEEQARLQPIHLHCYLASPPISPALPPPDCLLPTCILTPRQALPSSSHVSLMSRLVHPPPFSRDTCTHTLACTRLTTSATALPSPQVPPEEEARFTAARAALEPLGFDVKELGEDVRGVFDQFIQ